MTLYNDLYVANKKKPKAIISRIRHEIARLKDDLFTASTIKGIDWNELYDIEEEQEKLKETILQISFQIKIKLT